MVAVKKYNKEKEISKVKFTLASKVQETGFEKMPAIFTN
jgi:hypothetical protein